MTGANFLNLLHSIYLTVNSSVSDAHRTHIPSYMQITSTEHLQIYTITTHTHIHTQIYIYIYIYICIIDIYIYYIIRDISREIESTSADRHVSPASKIYSL